MNLNAFDVQIKTKIEIWSIEEMNEKRLLVRIQMDLKFQVFKFATYLSIYTLTSSMYMYT